MSKVFLGLSGGVDSAVSAALLKERGFEITGVFIRIWSPEWLGCTSREDRLDAMRVAAHLGIPYREIDLTEKYKKEVVDYMIREYKVGRTPNPDVFCNKYIKFGVFFDWAIAEGSDFVATGHYARVENQNGVFKMLSGCDKSKDQSYFLWTLTQKQLSKTIFPVGDLMKSQVRAIAKKYKLPNALRKDSQGLCFVGPVDVKDFLEIYAPQKKGNVLDENGNVIGEHPGALFFTTGERHGFTITKKTPNDAPSFVVSKDMKNNTITVAHKIANENASFPRTVLGNLFRGQSSERISNTNWISEKPKIGKNYKARVRHLGELLSCKLENDNAVVFEKPVVAAPGQSIVFYDGEICLGGAIIES